MTGQSDLLFALAAVFAAAALAPWIARAAGRASGLLLALVPAALLLIVVRDLGQPASVAAFDWVPELGARLSFRLDGLSRVFALAISGIAIVVLVYSDQYLRDHPRRPQFLGILMLFCGAMLGVVLADDLVALFGFWELTAVTSFLLIGFERERPAARRAATQALVVTGAGGLALMVAGILLQQIAGSWELSAVREAGDALRASPFYPLVLGAVLLAAFTKSAQVPFQFWLPNAMEAPTPVSAFLHSATMVQAGVYLLARLSPALGGTPAWQMLLGGFGAATLLWGGLAALRQTDLKQILAQSTVASLGLLVLLLGIGGEAAALAVALYFVAHALFKAALFLVAGAIDHGTGTRDITALGGLWRAMPLSFAATLLAALAMLGLPPLLGFIAKEEIYVAGLPSVWIIVLVAGNALIGAAGLMMLVRAFLGPLKPTPHTPHEADWAMSFGPLLLGVIGLLSSLWLGQVGDRLAGPLAESVTGETAHPHISLAINVTAPTFQLSLLTWALALLCAWQFDRIGALLRRVPGSFDAAFDALFFGLVKGAAALGRQVQHGKLELYVAVAVGSMSLAMLLPMRRLGAWPPPLQFGALNFYEWGAVALAVIGVGVVVVARTRLGAVVALGIQGLALAMIFLFFGAPDLGFTQLMVETLSVVILALVMTRLRLSVHDPRPAEDWLRDGGLALVAGVTITTLLFRVLATPLDTRLSQFFAQNSVPVAHGHNIVNVILVDFRGLDTLGEISVVMTAGIVVLALVRSRHSHTPGRRAAR